jgi:hypothetical protein
MDVIQVQIRFWRGDASADALQSVADDVLAELTDPASDAVKEALTAGIDLASIDGVAVEFRETAHGLEPFVTSVLVGITVAAGSKIAESIWQDLIWPRIKRRLGAGALGPRHGVGS